jgi:hypothetical protein
VPVSRDDAEHGVLALVPVSRWERAGVREVQAV